MARAARRGKVLHLLSQRPSLTGSGVTLDALIRRGRQAGWEQAAVVGVPAEDPRPAVGGLPQDKIFPLVFGEEPLGFPLPGMSDVMPYPSSRFSALTPEQLRRYRRGWSRLISEVIARFAPQVIHTHHLWLMSAMVPDVAHGITVVAHCHATGLRQLSLCPHLAPEVISGCRRLDLICALHRENQRRICQALSLPPERVSVVGVGYRERIFNAGEATDDPALEPGANQGGPRGQRVLYAGKLSRAKGLPWLLAAFDDLAARRPGLELHIAGSGAGPEAEELGRAIACRAPRVVSHGHLDQRGLARLMRSCAVFVLPSLYEGLPLVLVEALACGCRLVATELPGVLAELAPLSPFLERVPLPRLRDIDAPEEDDLPAFTAALARALDAALDKGCPEQRDPALTAALAPFGWGAVFERVQAHWLQLSGAD